MKFAFSLCFAVIIAVKKSVVMGLASFALLMPAYAASLPDIAGTIWQAGSAKQGGLITAQLPAPATVTLDGTLLALSDDLYFAFGFHRDDIAPQKLTIQFDNGTLYQTDITPQERRYKTQSITGLASKYVSPPEAILARIAQDRQDVIAARAHATRADEFIKQGFDWPLEGTITGVYGSQRILNGKPRAPHYGIDIAAPQGTIIYAPADGIVTMAHDLYYTGGTIILDHGLSISSSYLHLETMTVAVGAHITRGQPIGTVGSTGRSTGPHLDWRINWRDKRLDPELSARTR